MGERMRSIKILKLANLFYSLATESESLPRNSSNLKTILKNIDQLDNYKSRIKYCEDNLKRLSSGSSRIAYLTKDNTVIKLAKNDKGIDQNKAECKVNLKSKYLNKSIDCSNNYYWVEFPFLEKITEKEFEKMTGVNFKDFGESIRFGLKSLSDQSSRPKPKNFDKVSDSEIYKEMLKIGKKYNLMPGDLAKISSWGSKNDFPVLIDAGLTKEVFELHYASSSSESST